MQVFIKTILTFFGCAEDAVDVCVTALCLLPPAPPV